MLLCENNKYTKVKVRIPSALKETQTFPTKKLKNIFSQVQNSYLFGLNDIDQEDKVQEVEKIVPLKIDEAQIDKTINLNESLTIRLGDPIRLKEDYK